MQSGIKPITLSRIGAESEPNETQYQINKQPNVIMENELLFPI